MILTWNTALEWLLYSTLIIYNRIIDQIERHFLRKVFKQFVSGGFYLIKLWTNLHSILLSRKCIQVCKPLEKKKKWLFPHEQSWWQQATNNCYSNANGILLLSEAGDKLFVLGIIHNDLKVAESSCVQNAPLYSLLSGRKRKNKYYLDIVSLHICLSKGEKQREAWRIWALRFFENLARGLNSGMGSQPIS